jgi:murein L,D-transpeptidase YafK
LIHRLDLRGPLVRALAISAVLAAGLALSGCNTAEMSLASNAKANKPIPEKLVAEIAAKDMDLQSPMLVRLFKQEAELEVWKQNRSGQFALLKTYPICRWSGDLGPKVKEGDRQAPEGFYNITPAQMNPQSSYYLSFNMGYPNAFDKSLGRTGSQLMVHGDCSSRGCYAMTDEQISDIYALGRESFFGGQRSFQVQAYPFKMTPVNMAKHRNNPNMPFWKMIKQGYDHFEVTKQEPRVEFCENRYVFDPAVPANNMSRAPVFNASAKCPAYTVAPEIADAVSQKQRADDAKTAELVAKGVAIAARRPDIDGGMNRIFASKLPEASTGLSDPIIPGIESVRAPGTIPPHVNPPKPNLEPSSAALLASASSEEPVVAVTPGTKVASASSEGGFFRNLAKKVGIGGSSETTASTPAPAAPAKSAASKPASATKPVVTPADAKHAGARPKSEQGSSLSGAAPTVPANSFDTRFSAAK